MPPSIVLFPWNAADPQHISRMKQQRRSCGWNEDQVENWTPLQQSGAMHMFWIVASPPSHPSTIPSELTAKHLAAFPDEAEALSGAVPDSSTATFYPLGHIAVSHPLKPDHILGDPPSAAPPGNPLIIGNFYVSSALQSSGVGSMAMNMAERFAKETLAAGTLLLFTVEGKAQQDRARWEALNLTGADQDARVKVSLQEWYERRGYVVYERIEGRFDRTDSTGKLWPAAAVGMKLVIKAE